MPHFAPVSAPPTASVSANISASAHFFLQRVLHEDLHGVLHAAQGTAKASAPASISAQSSANGSAPLPVLLVFFCNPLSALLQIFLQLSLFFLYIFSARFLQSCPTALSLFTIRLRPLLLVSLKAEPYQLVGCGKTHLSFTPYEPIW